ncbi:MAG: 4-hydroxy-tetrahydrodipicolinate reductase [Acetobacteraceae bacterium]
MTPRIGIAGASGRMGRLIAEEARSRGLPIAGGICRPEEAAAVPAEVGLLPGIAALAAAADVVIDFTHASTIPAHAAAIAATGCGWVLGTTGLADDDEAAIAAAAARAPVVRAANFSPGVALVLELAARLAAALPAAGYDAEILEMHHRQKVDAPSGTALALGAAVAAARGQDLAAVAERGRDGAPGPRKPGAIGFAALRGGQIVGEHSLLFTSGAEQIILTHRAFDRRAFAEGALRAALWLAGRPAGLYGMADVLAG